MLGHPNKDETDGRSRGSPLMSLIRKLKPKRRHRSRSTDSQNSQRQVEERARNGKRDSQTSSVGSDLMVESEVAGMQEGPQTFASFDVTPKPPGSKEIVSLVSEKSTQGDGMLRVTSDLWEGTGQQELFKVDCKGRYDDPGTKFLWYNPKPVIKEHENCLGAYLNAIDPCKKSSTSSLEEQYPFRLCCHEMRDGKIHLAAHKVQPGTQDTEELIYVCKDKERSGVITLQENVSNSKQPLAGYFIGSTNDGQLQMFPHGNFEPYTANPFALFYIMDVDVGEVKGESTKRMNGEK